MCDINYHVEVYVGLIITPAGIKYIIYFDGVGLHYLCQIIFGGDDSGVAVLCRLTVDVSLAVNLLDGEG